MSNSRACGPACVCTICQWEYLENFWGWRKVVLEGNIPLRINFVQILLSSTPEADALVSGALTKVSPALMAKERFPQQLPRGHLEGAEQSGRDYSKLLVKTNYK